ncbi:hypothetical protein [Methylomonas albis]|nr:hypothetical protein [Methylomonas albis]
MHLMSRNATKAFGWFGVLTGVKNFPIFNQNGNPTFSSLL